MIWKEAARHESGDDYGVKVLVKCGRDLTEKEESELGRFADKLIKDMRMQTAMDDPKTAEMRQEMKRRIAELFNGRAIFLKEIANEYCREACCVGSPWFLVTSDIGVIKVGWRRRVLVIDWIDSIVGEKAEELFPAEDVTKEGWMIHAWGYEKAKEYLAFLHGRAK